MRIKNRASCTNSDYKKMGNLNDKGKFQQKWRVCQKFIKGLAKYSNEMTKSDKFGKKSSKVRQKIFKKLTKEMTKRGILKNGDYNRNGKSGSNS